MPYTRFKWWKHGVIYHIYVRSFYDSNNDGIGDLQGVIEKIPYLKTLGVDAIWLSPIYKSPNNDFGYDISDFIAINEEYGSMADFDELLEIANQHDIKIIMDMVLNHTSDQHQWFLESRSSISSHKRNWYIWKKGRETLFGRFKPNNWKTAFGKSGWKYDELSGEYYFHSFLEQQPDLNWRNPEVKEALFSVIQFWLDKGVGGLRLDLINYIIKDKKFRNNPNLISQLLFSSKVYTRNRPKSFKIIKELRQLVDAYPHRMTVGEIYTMPPGDSKLVSKYLGKGKNALHMAFDFSLIFTAWNARKVAKTLQSMYDDIPRKGWPSIVFSNHDLLRAFSKPLRKKHQEPIALLKAVLLFTLRGTPFIYYGEEIGMANTPVPRKLMKDQLGKLYWPFYKGRDRARTPMQWNSSKNAGFSENTPWLPVNSDYAVKNSELQLSENDSLLNNFIKLINLRKQEPVLYKGKIEIAEKSEKAVLRYKRIYKDNNIEVIINFTNKTKIIDLDIDGEILYSTHPYNHNQHIVQLRAFEAIIVKQ